MNITVIIPVHKYSEEHDAMLKDAISSVDNSAAQIFVVASDDVFNAFTFDKSLVKHVNVPEGSTNFQYLVNKGVSECNTKYFSVLELDDKFTKNAFSNFEKYSNSEFSSNIMLFLTEAVDYSSDEKGSIGYINEAVWARGFTDELGRIDSESIKDYFGFNITGSIIDKDEYLRIGGLKESIKMSFWYEFMLRALHNGLTTFVIPKVGYLHAINRTDSMTDICEKTISQDEADWWLELARKEYFYKEDRNKTYEE